ncbi:MAG: carcinine hydrolase/isopenicillin-N N-acyltransferase family protein [Candidatus Hodarchaeota archaeon]
MNKTFISLLLICSIFIFPSFRILYFNSCISNSNPSSDCLINNNLDSPSLPYTSCTIFTVEYNSTIYFASSEDESGQRKNTRFWFVPATEEGDYGAVYFGFWDNLPGGNDIDGLAIGGMNSQGLCFDANGVMPPVYVISNQSGPPRGSISNWKQILQECATVEEVIQWHFSHNMCGWWGNQIHWADATGDAVVISAGQNNQVAFTRKNSDYLISTNFNLDNYSHGYYPCARYSTVKDNLDFYMQQNEITEKIIQKILNLVQLVGTSDYIGTVYSYIFYPKTLDVVLYVLRDYEHPVRFNLQEELLKGEREVRIQTDLHSSFYTSSAKIPGFDLFLLYPLVIFLLFPLVKNRKKQK